jgi:hypothetical protein
MRSICIPIAFNKSLLPQSWSPHSFFKFPGHGLVNLLFGCAEFDRFGGRVSEIRHSLEAGHAERGDRGVVVELTPAACMPRTPAVMITPAVMLSLTNTVLGDTPIVDRVGQFRFSGFRQIGFPAVSTIETSIQYMSIVADAWAAPANPTSATTHPMATAKNFRMLLSASTSRPLGPQAASDWRRRQQAAARIDRQGQPAHEPLERMRLMEFPLSHCHALRGRRLGVSDTGDRRIWDPAIYLLL